MHSSVSFVLDGKVTTIEMNSAGSPSPTTTVLNYLRNLPDYKGVKEGCAEGDCGACTLVVGECGSGKKVRYKSLDSCLVFLPMLHGKQLITVENLQRSSDELHPVQQAMVETNGSQCGYCTPGFIMSLFALYKNHDHPSREHIDDALTGNLCRCTGYKPIVEAAAASCVHQGKDQFTQNEPHIGEMLRSISQESLHLHTEHQQYHRPASLQEAVAFKHAHPQALVINGATDVALRVTKGHELLREILDLSGIDELGEITETSSLIRIGAGASLSDVAVKIQKEFPALHDMLSVFGSLQIRNLATLGGNVGTASPIGDTPPVLMAYNARIVLESLNGRREVPFDKYFTGYRQTLRKPDELITAIIIPKPAKNVIIKSYKISKRKDLDISTLSGGFRLELDDKGNVKDILLAYGGMAEKTKRAVTTEQFLLGKTWSREIIEKAMPLIDKDFTPIADARGGVEMRRIAAKNLLMKFLNEPGIVE